MNIIYYVGLEVICNDIQGTVIENFKLPGDVCVRWSTGQECSYDVEWLDAFAQAI